MIGLQFGELIAYGVGTTAILGTVITIWATTRKESRERESKRRENQSESCDLRHSQIIDRIEMMMNDSDRRMMVVLENYQDKNDQSLRRIHDKMDHNHNQVNNRIDRLMQAPVLNGGFSELLNKLDGLLK